MKLNTVEPSSSDERQICRHGRVVCRMPGRVIGLENKQREQERGGVTHAHHLQDRHLRAEKLRHGIEAGEQQQRRRSISPMPVEPLPASSCAGSVNTSPARRKCRTPRRW